MSFSFQEERECRTWRSCLAVLSDETEFWMILPQHVLINSTLEGNNESQQVEAVVYMGVPCLGVCRDLVMCTSGIRFVHKNLGCKEWFGREIGTKIFTAAVNKPVMRMSESK